MGCYRIAWAVEGNFGGRYLVRARILVEVDAARQRLHGGVQVPTLGGNMETDERMAGLKALDLTARS